MKEETADRIAWALMQIAKSLNAIDERQRELMAADYRVNVKGELVRRPASNGAAE